MVDPSIIASVKNKENAAFKAMYQQCIDYVYSIVRRYITNESDYSDVIQEIFARVFLSIKTFDETKGDFKFWLRRLVINQCMQHYRQQKSPRLLVPIDIVNDVTSGGDHPLHNLSKAEIKRYLDRMPEGYRQIFMLVVIDEYSHKEVGKLLGISTETSRSQLSRAKRWLRKNVWNNNKQKLLASGL